jgi:hypothetical protein
MTLAKTSNAGPMCLATDIRFARTTGLGMLRAWAARCGPRIGRDRSVNSFARPPTLLRVGCRRSASSRAPTCSPASISVDRRRGARSSKRLEALHGTRAVEHTDSGGVAVAHHQQCDAERVVVPIVAATIPLPRS